MEGMLWGVAAMVVKDAVKQPYLKGRDYERNVRQVYRDVDNLKITVDHVKANCQGEDLEHGTYAPFIKRAERQLKDAYRTLKKNYPRKAGLSFLAQYASTPGAEMHLLDIGKEANQTARGLGDLLSEIRFAKIGKPRDSPPPDSFSTSSSSPPQTGASSPVRDMALYEDAVSDDSRASSPRSLTSEQSSVFDRELVRPSNRYSPPSSSSTSSPRKRSTTSRRSRSQSISEHRKALPASPSPQAQRLDVILESGAEREHALDNLQIGIDNVLSAVDEEHEGETMDYLEHALAEVLRLQKTKGFAGSPLDEDLGDAVEDLDDSMNSLLGARGEKEKKYAMKRLSHALDDVDHALNERQKFKDRVAARRLKQIEAEPRDTVLPTHQPTRGKLRRQNTGTDNRSRRYSMYK